MNAFLLMAVSLLAADECPVDITSREMTFAVTFHVDLGTKSFREREAFAPGKGVFTLPAGEHTIAGRNKWQGFPQNVSFTVKDKDGKPVWKSEPTVDPRLIKLEAGQTLEIEVPRPYEAYNTKFFDVSGVAMAINFQRPYAWQDVEKDWKAAMAAGATEEFPNSLFFLVDENWGPEKVFKHLAESASSVILGPKGSHGNYRSQCHVSLLCQLNADGTVPKALLDQPSDTLIANIYEGSLAAYRQMLAEKCHRTLSDKEAAELKLMGLLPIDTVDGTYHLAFRTSVEKFAPIFLKQWKEKPKKK